MLQVTIFNEFVAEQEVETIREFYPEGIHGALKYCLECEEISVRTITQDNVCDITEELLAGTDVLIWWGHFRHGDVPDKVAECVQQAVIRGMGAIFLHSAHNSKPFKLLMGTPCSLAWREAMDWENIWTCNPGHPIAKGVSPCIHLEHEEMYGEPFWIPEPDELVFIGCFEGGEVFRSGCCYRRGRGKIFYFQPGHEGFPTYHHPDVAQIIRNAVQWAKRI